MKLKLLLLYSIQATYGRIQMTEMQKSLSETSLEGERGVRPAVSRSALYGGRFRRSEPAPAMEVRCAWDSCPQPGTDVFLKTLDTLALAALMCI